MRDKQGSLPSQKGGFFQDTLIKIKLILRLMGDRRVNFLLKLLPLAGLIYLVSPIDLIPDIALPVVGYLDDAAVIWLCMKLFVALCPKWIVQEQMNAMGKNAAGTRREADSKDEEGDIVDAEARDVPPEG